MNRKYKYDDHYIAAQKAGVTFYDYLKEQGFSSGQIHYATRQVKNIKRRQDALLDPMSDPVAELNRTLGIQYKQAIEALQRCDTPSKRTALLKEIKDLSLILGVRPKGRRKPTGEPEDQKKKNQVVSEKKVDLTGVDLSVLDQYE